MTQRLKSLAAEKHALALHDLRTEQAALRAEQRRAAVPLDDVIAQARAAVAKRRAKGKPAVMPAALQEALAYDGADRKFKEPPAAGQQAPHREQPAATAGEDPAAGGPRQVVGAGGKRRGTTPLGAIVKGMALPGFKPKEGSRFAYENGSNFIDRQVPPERD